MPKDWKEVTYGKYSQNKWGIEDGFLTSYGTTAMGNDFSEYAKEIFTVPKKVIEASGKIDVVKNKTCLFLEIYTEIDPKTKAFFREEDLDYMCRDLNFDVINFDFINGEIKF